MRTKIEPGIVGTNEDGVTDHRVFCPRCEEVLEPHLPDGTPCSIQDHLASRKRRSRMSRMTLDSDGYVRHWSGELVEGIDHGKGHAFIECARCHAIIVFGLLGGEVDEQVSYTLGRSDTDNRYLERIENADRANHRVDRATDSPEGNVAAELQQGSEQAPGSGD